VEFGGSGVTWVDVQYWKPGRKGARTVPGPLADQKENYLPLQPVQLKRRELAGPHDQRSSQQSPTVGSPASREMIPLCIDLISSKVQPIQHYTTEPVVNMPVSRI
jgi:hypothetical protein